ncbi:MAG: UDP-N-acetylmuramoyl-L-alanyl-D-glutamate--2,6-diaminopimelate ligase [Desulfobacteraceae bacterium]|nr:UDP-N-acetylmuramoyl-L-alanyl-D-glutamate--2,6-diaminopimelate ligase [Desulfobacteraceae bacterium]
MKLSYLMKEVIVPWDRRIMPNSEPDIDPEITSIHAKAQDVKPGGLFFAIKGFTKDGHDYIEKAFEKKAAAVLVQKMPDRIHPDMVPVTNVIQVKDTRKAMACIASRFFGDPTEKITLIGITGTNGKTTTTWLLEAVLKAAGYKVGVIGTINVRYNGKIYDTPVTTPESIDLQKIFSGMIEAGTTHVIMEVSSHAVDLHRVDCCKFDIGVFTNFTQDHLDYHETMDAYWKCKKIFFTKILSAKNSKGPPTAVLNINDKKGSKLIDLLSKKDINIFKVGINKNADLSCKDIKDDISGLKATIFQDNNAINIHSPLAGGFNLENILSAAGAALALGISFKNIKKGIEECSNIPGRLERIENNIDRFIFVDYAHTPDALESILKTLKQRAKSKLITLFGCGGDRDPLKRKIMGKIAAEYSDLIIVTSDNPRSEDPEKIIRNILEGINIKGTKKELIVETDREKALKIAVKCSNPGDIIIAAGKGHETYQILKNGKIDFDDRAILKEAV